MAQKQKKNPYLSYPEGVEESSQLTLTEAAKVPSNIKQTTVTAEKGTASYPMSPPSITIPEKVQETETIESTPSNPYQEMLGVRTADWFNMDNLDGYMKNAAERYKKSVEGRSAGLVADAEYGKNDILDSHNEAYRALRAQNRENINALPGQMTRLGLYGSGTGEVALSNIQTDFQNQYNELIKQKNKGIMDIDNQIRQIRRDAATKIDDYYAQLASQYPQYYMQMLHNKVNAFNSDRSYLMQDKQHNDNMAFNWAKASAQNNQWYAGFEREGKWREEDIATRKQEIADSYAREDALRKEQKMDALVNDFMQKNPYAWYAIQNGTMDMPDFNKMYEMLYGEPYNVVTTSTETPVTTTPTTSNPYQSVFQQNPVNAYYGSYLGTDFPLIGGEKQKADSGNPFAPYIYNSSIKVTPSSRNNTSSTQTTKQTNKTTVGGDGPTVSEVDSAISKWLYSTAKELDGSGGYYYNGWDENTNSLYAAKDKYNQDKETIKQTFRDAGASEDYIDKKMEEYENNISRKIAKAEGNGKTSKEVKERYGWG